MNRYEQYKDTGIEMPGELPMHWDLLRLKDVAYLNSEVLNEDTDPKLKIQYIDIGNVSSNGTIDEIQEMEFAESPSRARRIVKKGDTIFSTVRTYLKAISFIDEAPDNLIASTGYAVIRPLAKTHPRYLYYLLTEEWFVGTVVARSTGVAYPAINAPQIASISAWLPPYSDQVAIADYLDKETTRIDQLITNKRQQIEKLNELRQITISRAVTQGLNLDAPMKDSGVEWLSEIPRHWDLSRVKYLGNFTGGGTPSKDNSEYWNGSIPWVSPKDMKRFEIHETIDSITDEAILDSTTQMIPVGSMLMVVRSGILQHSIPVAINEVAVTLNQDMKAFIPKRRLHARYLAYLIIGRTEDLLIEWRKLGATVESLEYDLITNTKIPVPGYDEQYKIIQFVEKEVGKLDKLRNNVEQQIQKQKELRKITIHNAVTGKIKVTD